MDIARGEKHHRSTISEIARSSMGAAGMTGSGVKGGRLSGAGAGLDQDEAIPAFDDNMMMENFMTSNSDADAGGALPYGEEHGSGMSQHMKHIMGDEGQQQYGAEGEGYYNDGGFNDGGDGMLQQQDDAEAQAIAAEEKRREDAAKRKAKQQALKKKRMQQQQQAAKGKKGNFSSVIDHTTELTNAEIKQSLNDTAPIVRVSSRRRRIGGITGQAKEGPSRDRAYRELFFDEEVEEGADLSPEQRLAMPGMTGLCAELREVYSMTMKEDRGQLDFPVEYVPSSSAGGRSSTDRQSGVSDVEGARYGGEEGGAAGVDAMIDGARGADGRLSNLTQGSMGKQGRFSDANNRSSMGTAGGAGGNLFEDDGYTMLEQNTDYDAGYNAEEGGYSYDQSGGVDVLPPLDEGDAGAVEGATEGGEADAAETSRASSNPFAEGAAGEGGYEDIYGGADAPSYRGSKASFLSRDELQEQQMSTRTAKVLEVMKLQLQEREEITFDELTEGASKRTAAACFLEILQLKTWGYIDTVQPQPFENIAIHATVSSRRHKMLLSSCLFLLPFFLLHAGPPFRHGPHQHGISDDLFGRHLVRALQSSWICRHLLQCKQPHHRVLPHCSVPRFGFRCHADAVEWLSGCCRLHVSATGAAARGFCVVVA